MFCPECRSEFREEITFCQSCEVDLVGALETEDLFTSIQTMEGTLAEAELVPVVMGNPAELRRLQEGLYRERLPSVLANAGEGAYTPGTAAALYLMAQEEDLQKIGEYIKRANQESLHREGVVEEVSLGQITACPACGSEAPGEAAECPECGLMLGVSEDDGENH